MTIVTFKADISQWQPWAVKSIFEALLSFVAVYPIATVPITFSTRINSRQQAGIH
jgi:hypothetical protein